MKTISNSVKAQFQANYLYQPVWLRHSYTKEHPPIVLVPKLLWQYEEADGYLQLRSVSDLTDEEYYILEVLYFERGVTPDADKERVINTGKRIAIKYLDATEFQAVRAIEFLQVGDYLRSIGIAIPFTYLDESHHPITLSVEELVNLNWVEMSTSSMP